jgi:hypothetical protein
LCTRSRDFTPNYVPIFVDIADSGRYGPILAVPRHLHPGSDAALQNLRMLMALPKVMSENLRDLQEGVTGLYDGLIRTNLSAPQEQSRLADVRPFIRLQQRAVHNYMDALIQG